MPILKFFWLAVRPVSRFESGVGAWDVVNLVLLIAYPTIGAAFSLGNLFQGAHIAWLAGIPILLLFIAGLKLQFRLAGIENAYHYALSLDDIDIEKKHKALELNLKLSNAIDKPIEYELIANRTYIEIVGKQRAVLETNDKGIISARKSSMSSLPEITSPEYSPCRVLHYELVYGSPDKPLFKQVREYDLEINLSQTEVVVKAKSKFEEDKPIKK